MEIESKLVEIFKNNLDIFTWSREDMVGINLNIIMHTLNLDRNVHAKVHK